MFRVYACMLSLLAIAPLGAEAGQGSTAPDSLPLEAAVEIALARNRSLQSAALEAAKATERVATSRSNRLPSFSFSSSAGQLLTPVTFSFPRGAFGEFAGTGPIPADDTNIEMSRRPQLSITSQISQPITQLGRLGLAVRASETALDIERESLRSARLRIAGDVRRLYFAMLRSESLIASLDEALVTYRELQRTMADRLSQQTVLRAEVLEVNARLAEAELARVSRQSALSAEREQFNQLLGRDLRTPFSLVPVPDQGASAVDLPVAIARALAERPDIRTARLRVQHAELEQRVTRAGWQPDLSVSLSYMSTFNADVLPRNITSIGVQLEWEPFDWGRRRQDVVRKTHTTTQAINSLRDLEDQAAIEIASRYREWQEAAARLNVARASMETARERLRVRMNQYEQQAALTADVLEARSALASANADETQARITLWAARAVFEQSLGWEVSR